MKSVLLLLFVCLSVWQTWSIPETSCSSNSTTVKMHSWTKTQSVFPRERGGREGGSIKALLFVDVWREIFFCSVIVVVFRLFFSLNLLCSRSITTSNLCTVFL